MNKAELEQALAKAKRQLSVAKESDEKEFAQKKIDRLEADLAKQSAVEDIKEENEPIKEKKEKVKKPSKPKAEKKAEPKKQSAYNKFVGERMGKYMKEGMSHGEAMKKIASEWKELKGKTEAKPEPETLKKYTPFKVNPSEKHQDVIPHHYKLHKINDNVYEMIKIKDNRPHFEFEKKSDNKWHVQCKVGDKKAFNSLQGAVNYVAKSLYQGELKDLLKEKAQKKASTKKWQEKNPEGVTPAKAVETATEKVIKKVEEQQEEGKPIKNTLKQVLANTKQLINELREYKKDIDKAEVRSMIESLKKLL